MSNPNPLDMVGQDFTIELMNPNPTSSKTKAGAVYRVSFEVHREAWDLFMDGNTEGMLLEGTMRVTAVGQIKVMKPESSQPPEPEAKATEASDEDEPDRKAYPKAALLSQWCKETAFRAWLKRDLHREIRGEADARLQVKGILAIESMREIDEKPDVGVEFDKIFRRPYMQSRRR